MTNSCVRTPIGRYRMSYECARAMARQDATNDNRSRGQVDYTCPSDNISARTRERDGKTVVITYKVQYLASDECLIKFERDFQGEKNVILGMGGGVSKGSGYRWG